jgi:hypothetical protein
MELTIDINENIIMNDRKKISKRNLLHFHVIISLCGYSATAVSQVLHIIPTVELAYFCIPSALHIF